MQTLLFSPFKAILFDMDNTLFDFLGCLKKACAEVVSLLGVGTADELYNFYFRGKYSIEDSLNLQEYMEKYNCFTIDNFLKAMSTFETSKKQILKPYEGIPEVLSTLKNEGYKLAVVTDAYTYAAEDRLGSTDLTKYFDVCVGFDMTGHKKPHHAPFECALDLLNCKPFEAMFIGDSLRRDVDPATGVGMIGVHAKYGSKEENYPYSPQFSVNSPIDILKIVHGQE